MATKAIVQVVAMRTALMRIADQETPYSNATVRRMAQIARNALFDVDRSIETNIPNASRTDTE